MDLRKFLSNCSARKTTQSKEDLVREEERHFDYYLEKWKKEHSSKSKYKSIPQFFFQLPNEKDTLKQKLREEARTYFLQKKSEQLLQDSDLKDLWVLLDKHHSSPYSVDLYDPQQQPQQLINYTDFMKVKELAESKCQQYFRPSVFAKLQQGDPYGRVSIVALFNYILRKVWMQQTRINLSLYDTVGRGYLRENELENYIFDLIGTLPQLDGLDKSFHSFYVCTAVRKFLFFLDPLRTGRVRIQDILACSFLDDLMELRAENLPKGMQEQNWFSPSSALHVYGQYLALDRNHNGMLNKEELAEYGSGTWTKVFLDRVFQECLTYEGEIDYKTYVDFVLALENRHEPQSLHYLFKILDINSQGYLDAFTLNYFFKGIQEQMKEYDLLFVKFDDMKDQIFDMVKPADPTKITLQDLIACGQGDTMVSMLIEFHGFWTYEYRENIVSDGGVEESHEG